MGQAIDPYSKADFIIEIEGIRRAGFKSCSELSVELSVVALSEGGRRTPHKKPGKLTFADLTLDRGMTDDRYLYDWMEEVAALATGKGVVTSEVKRTFDVVALDRDNSERRRWTIFNAFPIKWAADGFDADSDTDATIESVTFAFDYFVISK